MTDAAEPTGADATSDGPRAEAERRYDGFISYSHAADGKLAPGLQEAAQRFAKPWWKRRALLVFRDETGLSVNPHLWSSISEALDDSRWFILLCSPEAAASPWVDREITHWKQHHDPAHILPILTEGEWHWDAARKAFDQDRSTAVPPALFDAFTDEPRHLDLRWARTDDQLNLRNGRFRAAVAEVAAPLRGVPREDLESEEIRLHRRAVRVAWAAAVVLALLATSTTVASVTAARNAESARLNAAAAQHNADEATDKGRQAESTRLGSLAADEAARGVPDRAMLLAVASMDEAGTDSGAARNALLAATGSAAGLERVIPNPDVEPGNRAFGSPLLGLDPSSKWAALADAGPPNPDDPPPIAVIDLVGGAPRVTLTPFHGTVNALLPLAGDRLVVVYTVPTAIGGASGVSTGGPSDQPARGSPVAPSDVPSDVPAVVPSDLPTDGPRLPASAGSPASHVQLFDVKAGKVLFDADASGPVIRVLGDAAIVVPQQDELTLVDVATGQPRAHWSGRIAGSAVSPTTEGLTSRAATVPERVVSADGTHLVGYAPAAGAAVSWDLAHPETPTILFPADGSAPPARFDPTGRRVAGIDASGTLVAIDPDGLQRRQHALPAPGPVAAFAVGLDAAKVVLVAAAGAVVSVDLAAGSASAPTATCASTPCDRTPSWTAELSPDSSVAVLTAKSPSTLADTDPRQTWLVSLTDLATYGPFTGVPVAFDGSVSGGISGATFSELGMPPLVRSVVFGNPGSGNVTSGMPLLSTDGAFVSLPRPDGQPSAATEEATLQPTTPRPVDAPGSLVAASSVPVLHLPYASHAQGFAVDADHVFGALVDGQLYVWRRTAVAGGKVDMTTAAEITPDGQRVARVAFDPTDPNARHVEIHTLSNGAVRSFTPAGLTSYAVRFDPSGRWLAVTPTPNGGTSSWLLDTLDPASAPTRLDAVAVVFSPDGSSMATWRVDGAGWKAEVTPVPSGTALGTVAVADLARSSTGASTVPVSALGVGGATLAVRTSAGIALHDVRGNRVSSTLALPAGLTPEDVVFDGGALRSVDVDHEVTAIRAWSDDGTLTGVAVLDGSAGRRLVTGPDGLLLAVDQMAQASAYLVVGPSLSPVGTVDPVFTAFQSDGQALLGAVSPYVAPPTRTDRRIDLSSLRRLACATAGRELTPLEWKRFLPDAPPSAACGAPPEHK